MNIATAEKVIHPRIMGVRLRQDYDETWMKDNKVKAVWGVFVYNERRHTNCCELTPSYELIFVHDQVEFDGEVSEAHRDRVENEVMGVESESASYMHVHRIDRIPLCRKRQGNRQERFLLYSAADCREWKMDHDEAIERAREYCQGNWQ
jgi:hypothetical protein